MGRGRGIREGDGFCDALECAQIWRHLARRAGMWVDIDARRKPDCFTLGDDDAGKHVARFAPQVAQTLAGHQGLFPLAKLTFNDRDSNSPKGRGCHFAPWGNRSTQGLVPSSCEYPVLMVKRSVVWSMAERRLTILATARADVPE